MIVFKGVSGSKKYENMMEILAKLNNNISILALRAQMIEEKK